MGWGSNKHQPNVWCDVRLNINFFSGVHLNPTPSSCFPMLDTIERVTFDDMSSLVKPVDLVNVGGPNRLSGV